MKASNLEWRMYGLVAYQLSEIQKGIQFGHAVVEYGLEFRSTLAYQKWAREDKTFIILNGGTTNTRYDENDNHVGSLNNYRQTLFDEGIQFSSFFEPDLGDQLTAICFLVDERVFNRTKWPDYDGPCYLNGTPDHTEYWHWMMKFDESENEAQRIVFLRNFLKNFRLA